MIGINLVAMPREVTSIRRPHRSLSSLGLLVLRLAVLFYATQSSPVLICLTLSQSVSVRRLRLLRARCGFANSIEL